MQSISQLTHSETTFLLFVIALGMVVFVAVCAAIYFLFKRLERGDRAETERHQMPKNDDLES